MFFVQTVENKSRGDSARGCMKTVEYQRRRGEVAASWGKAAATSKFETREMSRSRTRAATLAVVGGKRVVPFSVL
jgi:hypothetical protein